jgi:hypothetical protein
MQLTDEAFERVCELMNAMKTDEYHEIGFSLIFRIANDEYRLSFGLPDDLVVLLRPHSNSFPDTQFLFRCNSVEFHSRSSKKSYMLCFTDVRDGLTHPRMLIAGGEDGATHFRLFSIPGNDLEFEFPQQL